MDKINKEHLWIIEINVPNLPQTNTKYAYRRQSNRFK